MMMSKDKGLMIDFETLGTSSNAVLLSVGVVVFTLTEVLYEGYWEFDINKQIAAGRIVDPSTVEWWNKMNPTELLRLLEEGEDSVSKFLDDFRSLGKTYAPKTVWSRGHLDMDIMYNLARPMWAYYQERDVRTLDELMGKKTNGHNALQDCLDQVEQVQKVLDMRVSK